MIFINKEKPNAVMEFGTGDICIAGGYIENERYGIVGFVNQSVREIGEVGDIKAGKHEFEEFDIMMEFSKVESIDVLIKELEKAKRYMLEDK